MFKPNSNCCKFLSRQVRKKFCSCPKRMGPESIPRLAVCFFKDFEGQQILNQFSWKMYSISFERSKAPLQIGSSQEHGSGVRGMICFVQITHILLHTEGLAKTEVTSTVRIITLHRHPYCQHTLCQFNFPNGY